jgi:hypothetical protein
MITWIGDGKKKRGAIYIFAAKVAKKKSPHGTDMSCGRG